MFAIQRHFNSNVVQGTREDFYAITGNEGLTPSGDGLRLVTIALPGLNLADNQAAVAAALSTLLPVAIECDPSVINADRISFAPAKDDIWFINERLFTYQDEDYNDALGDCMRLMVINTACGKRLNDALDNAENESYKYLGALEVADNLLKIKQWLVGGLAKLEV